MKTVKSLAVLALLAGTLAGTGPAKAATPVMTVDKTTVKPDVTFCRILFGFPFVVTATGNGFNAGEELQLWIRGNGYEKAVLDPEDRTPFSFNVSQSGSFSAPFVVPKMPSGSYELIAYNAIAERRAVVGVTVVPHICVSIGAQGGGIWASAGWDPEAPVWWETFSEQHYGDRNVAVLTMLGPGFIFEDAEPVQYDSSTNMEFFIWKNNPFVCIGAYEVTARGIIQGQLQVFDEGTGTC